MFALQSRTKIYLGSQQNSRMTLPLNYKSCIALIQNSSSANFRQPVSELDDVKPLTCQTEGTRRKKLKKNYSWEIPKTSKIDGTLVRKSLK